VDVDRARVLAVIRAIADAIADDRACGIVRETEPGACELVRRACAAHGLTVEQWSAELHADAELVRLFDQVLIEIVVDPPDPGPYDEISRESPCPEPEPDAFERDERLLGRALG
jgi:hypothetical protein